MAETSGQNTLGVVRAVTGALAAIFLTLGCHDEGPFSDNDMDRLRTFRLTALPADPSNAKADDAEAAKLGKLLYFDSRFSGPLGPYNTDGTNGSLGVAGEIGKVGCVSCHDPASGGTDHRSLPNATSLGAGYTGRNSPSVINAAYSPLWQFWDGRKDSLWSQALSPPEGTTEDNSSRLCVVHFLWDRYRGPYEAVFGAMPDVSDTTRFPPEGMPGDPSFDGMALADQIAVNVIYSSFGKAIAAYERRLVSPNFEPSPFDRFMAGDTQAMSPGAIRGARLFIGRAGCVECHLGPLFSDFGFHNVGVPQQGQHVLATDDGRLGAIAHLTNDPFNRAGTYSDSTDSKHLAPFAGDLTDEQKRRIEGQFKTPTLRNVTKTAPYMHDGVYQNLWEVVNHYNFGGETGLYAGVKDVALSPLLLGPRDVDDLVEFLAALADGEPLPTADFPEGLTKPPPALP